MPNNPLEDSAEEIADLKEQIEHLKNTNARLQNQIDSIEDSLSSRVIWLQDLLLKVLKLLPLSSSRRDLENDVSKHKAALEEYRSEIRKIKEKVDKQNSERKQKLEEETRRIQEKRRRLHDAFISNVEKLGFKFKGDREGLELFLKRRESAKKQESLNELLSFFEKLEEMNIEDSNWLNKIDDYLSHIFENDERGDTHDN